MCRGQWRLAGCDPGATTVAVEAGMMYGAVVSSATITRDVCADWSGIP